ncbi:unnamed protein product [Pedinophyceae sp. YPF-701]|nr:unnamed protein product [Pedinophyceae sp. YPF-701]
MGRLDRHSSEELPVVAPGHARLHPEHLRLSMPTCGAVFLGCAALFLAGFALFFAGENARRGPPPGPVTNTLRGTQRWPRTVKRVAFGSCTAYDLRPQPIWDQIMRAEPDAWVWVGDFSYLDMPFVNCLVLPDHPECNCEPTWLSRPPFMCRAGDLGHARRRMQAQLYNRDYQRFLEFMCPGHETRSTHFPPLGREPELCARLLTGTWDDHDYGANNMDRRLPHKYDFQQLYLDAIGESPWSPRRSGVRGIYDAIRLNAESADAPTVDVVLLDERFSRDPLPCSARCEWCAEFVLAENPPGGGVPSMVEWCRDLCVNGGELGRGACCALDDQMHAGCPRASVSDPLYPLACDPAAPAFGTEPVEVFANGTIRIRTDDEEFDARDQFGLCEMLGSEQRRWLRRVLDGSDAELVLVASGSVLLSDPVRTNGRENRYQGQCGGDDWDCYAVARNQLLHELSRAKGCVAVLTGDYHMGDLKILRPGRDTKYAELLGTADLRRPIYQVMSSGMTTSTAGEHDPSECYGPDGEREASWMYNSAGLRVRSRSVGVEGEWYKEEPCGIKYGMNFGTVEVEGRRACLQIRDGDTGAVWDQVCLSLDTCEPVRPPEPPPAP